MGAIETVERAQLAERPAMRTGDTVRVHVKVREGDKERIQIFEGMVIGQHRGVRARDLHGAEGVVRPGRGAHLPAALADHRTHRRRPVGQGPPLEALLPAETEGQGRPHEGSPAPGVARPSIGTAPMRRVEATRTGRGCPRADRLRPRGRRRRGRPRLPGRPGGGRRGHPPSRTARFGASPTRSWCPRPSASAWRTSSARGALAWAVAEVGPADIDRMAIHRASLESMRRAVMALAPQPDVVLVDAFRIPGLAVAQRGIIHGDRLCASIAAASIVAKVHRDRLMAVLHDQDGRYGYARHKGYATPRAPARPRTLRLLGRITAVRSGRHRCLIRSRRAAQPPPAS